MWTGGVVRMLLREHVEHGRDACGVGVHHALAGLVTQDALQLQANALLVRVLVATLEHGDHRVEVALEVSGTLARCEIRRTAPPRVGGISGGHALARGGLALLPYGTGGSGHPYPPVSWRAPGIRRPCANLPGGARRYPQPTPSTAS